MNRTDRQSSAEPLFGDEVVAPWGFTHVVGTVREVYGPPDRRRVVVELEPESSRFVVAEVTTYVVDLADLAEVRPSI